MNKIKNLRKCSLELLNAIHSGQAYKNALSSTSITKIYPNINNMIPVRIFIISHLHYFYSFQVTVILSMIPSQERVIYQILKEKGYFGNQEAIGCGYQPIDSPLGQRICLLLPNY